jgi:hypothetical protein
MVLEIVKGRTEGVGLRVVGVLAEVADLLVVGIQAGGDLLFGEV